MIAPFFFFLRIALSCWSKVAGWGETKLWDMKIWKRRAGFVDAQQELGERLMTMGTNGTF